jgi:hypothetical protein
MVWTTSMPLRCPRLPAERLGLASRFVDQSSHVALVLDADSARTISTVALERFKTPTLTQSPDPPKQPS